MMENDGNVTPFQVTGGGEHICWKFGDIAENSSVHAPNWISSRPMKYPCFGG